MIRLSVRILEKANAWLLLCLLAGLALSGCSSEQSRPTASAAFEHPTELAQVSSSPTVLMPTAVETVEALPTGTPSPIIPAPAFTTIPTSTPDPVVLVFVPERWRDAATAAFQSPGLAAGKWDWQLGDTPLEATVLMVEGHGEIEAGQRRIALTVPFTHPLEEVSLQEAEDYVNNSREGMQIVDWEEIPHGFKALRIDGLLPFEEGYPLKQFWSLEAASEHITNASILGAALSEELSRPTSIHLAVVGDIMLDRSLGYAIRSGDQQYPFAEVTTALTSADITIGNLESSLGNSGEPVAKSYNFQAPPEAAQSLAMAGFDILSLANNHAMDYGPGALVQALELLDQNEIHALGAGENVAAARKPVVIELNGLRVAFLAYVDVPVEVSGFDTQSWEAGADSPGLAWAYPEIIIQDVSSAKASADVVVVILHSGYEFVVQPSPPQIASSQAAIDAGASLVIGHHSHLLQGISFYGDGVIAYGLSNFAFEMDGSSDSAILNVWLDKEGVRNLEIVPITIGRGGQPGIAAPQESRRIREDVYYLSDLLNQQ